LFNIHSDIAVTHDNTFALYKQSFCVFSFYVVWVGFFLSDVLGFSLMIESMTDE